MVRISDERFYWVAREPFSSNSRNRFKCDHTTLEVELWPLDVQELSLSDTRYIPAPDR